MSIVLILDFLLAKKWLIIEPKSPQSLKNIYQVLNFAAKHKAALNCSAFTNWEQDVPSRMDLGKSKYGGDYSLQSTTCTASWLAGTRGDEDYNAHRVVEEVYDRYTCTLILMSILAPL